MSYLRSLLIAAALLGSAAPASADFVLTVKAPEITPGGAASVEVFIRSSGAAESLDLFSIDFRVVLESGAGRLGFIDPPSAEYLVDPNYVFAGDSAAASLYPAPAGAVLTTVTLNDTFLGGDGTLSGAGATVTSADRLLARLELDTSAAVAGDRYTLNVAASPNTFFLNAGGSEVGATGMPSTITVAPAAAVPAPPGLLLAGVAAAALGGARLGRRGTRRPGAPTS